MAINQILKKEQLLWEICGHEKIVDYLKSSILANNLHHAYIFAGQSGLGKSLVAEKFIKTLFCLNKGEYLPCENCSNCRQISSGVFPDVYYLRRVIDEKTGKLKREIAIKQIRELKSRLSQASFLASWRVAIIEEAEFLNVNSSNSLLKVLEEPGKKTILILLINDLSKVLKTIDSRCQTLNFLPVAGNEIKDFLINRGLDENKAKKISRLAVGRPGQAIKLMDDLEMYGCIKNDIENFFKILNADLNQRFILLNDLIDWQKDETLNITRLIKLMENWLIALRDLMLKKNENDYYALDSSEQHEKLKKNISHTDILRINDLISSEYKNLKYNISSKNILENLIINI